MSPTCIRSSSRIDVYSWSSIYIYQCYAIWCTIRRENTSLDRLDSVVDIWLDSGRSKGIHRRDYHQACGKDRCEFDKSFVHRNSGNKKQYTHIIYTKSCFVKFMRLCSTSLAFCLFLDNFSLSFLPRKVGRAVDRAPLERVFTRKCNGGSNPPSSECISHPRRFASEISFAKNPPSSQVVLHILNNIKRALGLFFAILHAYILLKY